MGWIWNKYEVIIYEAIFSDPPKTDGEQTQSRRTPDGRSRFFAAIENRNPQKHFFTGVAGARVDGGLRARRGRQITNNKFSSSFQGGAKQSQVGLAGLWVVQSAYADRGKAKGVDSSYVV